MTRGAIPAASNSTRLAQLLSDLAAPDVRPGPEGFAEAMEGLIGFGESMKLAMLHDELARVAHEGSPDPMSCDVLKREVLDMRLALIRGVLDSFDQDVKKARPKLPRPCADVSVETLLTFEPYHRFYAAHQREFDARIHRLQLRVREALSGRSASLARLVMLDETLRDLVSTDTRKALAAIPALLGRRFASLLQEASQACGQEETQEPGGEPVDAVTGDVVSESAFGRDGWIWPFYRDMQDLLLAELDLRLMPVLGLVEAVEEEVTEK